MNHDATRFYESWPTHMNAMKTKAPDIGKAFGGMFQTLMREGALTVKNKELIALGIAVGMHCEPCIYTHVDKCLKSGASPGEVMEAAGVGVVMGGGPAYTYATLVSAALDHFAQATPATT